jgi:hypothetical protein
LRAWVRSCWACMTPLDGVDVKLAALLAELKALVGGGAAPCVAHSGFDQVWCRCNGRGRPSDELTRTQSEVTTHHYALRMAQCPRSEPRVPSRKKRYRANG